MKLNYIYQLTNLTWSDPYRIIVPLRTVIKVIRCKTEQYKKINNEQLVISYFPVNKNFEHNVCDQKINKLIILKKYK